VTCEVDDRAAAIARQAFESSPHGHKIDLKLGPAMDVIDRCDSLDR
jgi:predicted O-methyltransferase YrrM